VSLKKIDLPTLLLAMSPETTNFLGLINVRNVYSRMFPLMQQIQKRLLEVRHGNAYTVSVVTHSRCAFQWNCLYIHTFYSCQCILKTKYAGKTRCRKIPFIKIKICKILKRFFYFCAEMYILSQKKTCHILSFAPNLAQVPRL